MSDVRIFEYHHGDVALRGHLTMPAGPGPHPAVLVMRSALGLNRMANRRAQDLTAAGYVALATDMYGVGPREPTMAEVSEFNGALQTDPSFLRARVVATFEAVCALPVVDRRRIAAIGYCFGGQCVLELARSGVDVRAVVSFHGQLTTKLPAEPGSIKAKMLAITGALDPHAPIADVPVFQQEMTKAGADWQFTVYSQGMHAFTDAEVSQRIELPGLRYDALLDRLSWAQACEFLAANV